MENKRNIHFSNEKSFCSILLVDICPSIDVNWLFTETSEGIAFCYCIKMPHSAL